MAVGVPTGRVCIIVGRVKERQSMVDVFVHNTLQLINPQRMRARVIVIFFLSVCLSVCLSICQSVCLSLLDLGASAAEKLLI